MSRSVSGKGSYDSARPGQSLIEYGLIFAMITLVCITALSMVGGDVNLRLNCLAKVLLPGGASSNGFGAC